jgi:tetratricopeptide (TPR) repeat protein
METKPDSALTRGYQARREHRFSDAKGAFAEAVALYQKSNNPRLLAQSLVELGRSERDLGETEAARLHYEEAANIFRAGPDKLTLAHTVRHAADILREDGRLELAEPGYKEALEIYVAHEDTNPLELANAIRGFALLKGATGHGADAKLLWEEARELYASIDVQAGVAESEAQIARLAASQD